MSVSPPSNAPLRSAMKHTASTSSTMTDLPDSSSPPDSPFAFRPSMRSRPSTSSSIPSFSSASNTGSNVTPIPTPTLSSTMSPTASVHGYTPKVSFDTFENPAATMFSFTLGVKNDGYTRTRSTRVFLCAASADESGREALDWALESLVQDGDELIVCRGIDQEELSKDHDIVREEAREFMRQIQEKCDQIDSERKVSIILEYVSGRITDTLDRLIALYRPDSVVVGMRGRKTWQTIGGFGMGSVSKYCLSHSPVPIIVVRPERKVRKAIEKRRANPKRGKHFEE